jgi:hypothetical protein
MVTSMIIIEFGLVFYREKNSVFVGFHPHFHVSCDVLLLDLTFYFVASGSTSPVFGPFLISSAHQASQSVVSIFFY